MKLGTLNFARSPKRSIHNNPTVNGVYFMVFMSSGKVFKLSRYFLVLCNPKFHYRLRRRPPLDPIPSRFNPVHTLTHYLF